MPLAVVLKVFAVSAAATTGAAGLLWSATASGPSNPAVVWVDNPLQGATVEPGVVTVTAHASAEEAVTGLALLIDGEQVAADTSLDRNGLLSLGSFDWQASPGKHDVVVKAGSTSSDVVTVYVVERAPGAAATNAPTAAPTLTPSPTSTPTATSTATPSETPSPTTAPTPRPTVSAAPVRTTAPPSTPSPTPRPAAPAYVAGSIQFSHSNLYWDTNSGGNPCPQPHTVEATVTVSNATTVSIRVGDHSFTATRSGTSTWRATVDTSQISGPHNTTNLPVTVLSQGRGGSADDGAGTVPVYSCTKD